jgi:hypothetical protein
MINWRDLIDLLHEEAIGDSDPLQPTIAMQHSAGD